MLTKRVLTAILVAGAMLLAVGTGPGRAGVAQALPLGMEANLEPVTIPYAGALAGPAGQPVADGLYDFAFALYAAETGGELLWSEVQEGVTVEDGAFEAALGRAATIPAAVLDGSAHWLAVAVRGPGEATFTALSPRQQLSAASTTANSASAGAACPHDHVGEVWQGSVPWSSGALKVLNYSNGPSIWGWNGGNGNGLRGYATGTGLGVYGESQNSAGVVGRSTSGRGVEGYTTSDSQYGVYGKSESGGTGGIGVVGYAPNGNGVGVLGEGAWYGLYAKGDLRVEGYSLFDGGKTGYVVDVAQNDDVVALEAGDAVAISGAGPAVMGEIPVIKVRRATAAQAGAIVGVVDKRFTPALEGSGPDEISKSAIDDSAAGPGEYLTVVTLGAYKALKVDASFGAIAPGDRLVASSNPGYAMRADSPLPGTILGKALGEWSSGTGVIPVIVTLQ
ncbi:MAG: hypothetical protein ISS56_06945 [Anaerolineae bacterium]|nr:hypothetical protein [Anaerolineae bacterium]